MRKKTFSKTIDLLCRFGFKKIKRKKNYNIFMYQRRRLIILFLYIFFHFFFYSLKNSIAKKTNKRKQEIIHTKELKLLTAKCPRTSPFFVRKILTFVLLGGEPYRKNPHRENPYGQNSYREKF